MDRYGPQDGLHISWLSKGEAMRHTRRVYNVADGVGVGWTPYTVLITSYGAVAHTAFHSARELRRWLGPNYRVSLTGGHRTARFGRIVAR